MQSTPRRVIVSSFSSCTLTEGLVNLLLPKITPVAGSLV